MQKAEKMPPELITDLTDTMEYGKQIRQDALNMKAQAEAALQEATASLMAAEGVFNEAKRRAIKALNLLPVDSLNLTDYTFTRATPTESAKNEQSPASEPSP